MWANNIKPKEKERRGEELDRQAARGGKVEEEMHNSFMRWPKGICIFHGTLALACSLAPLRVDRHGVWPKTDRGQSGTFGRSVRDPFLTWSPRSGNGAERNSLSCQQLPMRSRGISDISRLSSSPMPPLARPQEVHLSEQSQRAPHCVV